MKNIEMRVVSIGDLVIDYYYKNAKLLGINGGMTCHNIIANLAKFGFETSVFGVCGNDLQGEFATKSLEILKVDISNIKKINGIRTRCFHISYFEEGNQLSFTSKKRCPFCKKKKWYDNSLIDCNDVLSNIKEDDILVFDNLNPCNQEIIDKTNNKFEIINFNERVSNYLITKLNCNSELELYHILSPKLMTITKGENGATFIFQGKAHHFKLLDKNDVIDSTGAGDAFISSIIKEWIKSDFKYHENLFEKWYKNSNKLTTKVVSKMGARGHLNSLFKIKKMKDYCSCDKFTYNERKKIKRCNININNLEKRVINAIHSQAIIKIKELNFSASDNCLFIGTGGSFAGTYFSAKVINLLFGCNTYPLYPRDVLYRNNTNINKVILFSYSGTTNDIINSIKDFSKENIYMITKGEIQNIVQKTKISKKNILSYRTSSNKGKERGFLSFEGAVAPAAMFLKYYYSKVDTKFDVDNFLKKSMDYWNKILDKMISKDLVEKITNKKIVNLFRGDYGDTACYDLESKIIESGIFNCIIHEKKNFSHGRFINYENLNNNFSVYFKEKTTSKYEFELLQYLKDNNLIIESPYNGILAEFDLLIASQLIIYYFGKRMDIDVSKPKYSEEAMKIYFYKGDL